MVLELEAKVEAASPRPPSWAIEYTELSAGVRVCAPILIGARRDRSRACGTQTRPRFGVMGVVGSATRVRGRRLHVKMTSDPRVMGSEGI